MAQNNQGRRGAQFNPGQVVATPGALAALAANTQLAVQVLARHVTGDWGDVDAADWAVNNHALRAQERLLSVYRLADGRCLYVITEWDRSVTTLLLPDEY